MYAKPNHAKYRPLWLGGLYTVLMQLIALPILIRHYHHVLLTTVQLGIGYGVAAAGWVMLIIAGVFWWNRN